MVSNRLTHRRTSISNPKICKSKLKPLRPLPPEEPPQWPPPYLRATLKVRATHDRLEFDLTLVPNYPANPTQYFGYTLDGYAYAAVDCTIRPTTSTFTPYHIYAYGRYEAFSAYNGTPVDIPNNAFQLLNDHWRWQDPSNAQITLIVAYP